MQKQNIIGTYHILYSIVQYWWRLELLGIFKEALWYHEPASIHLLVHSFCQATTVCQASMLPKSRDVATALD